MSPTFWDRSALLAGMVLLGSSAATAADVHMCEDMLVTVVRFTGTVGSVEQLGRRATQAADVGDIDPRYVVTVTVDAVEPNAVVERGKVLSFAVHSPARTFGSRTRAGSIHKLELEMATCHGSFWRFFALRPRSSAKPEAFVGELEVGRSYRAGIHWDAEAGRVLDASLELPLHHEGEIEFLDTEAAPALGPDRPAGSMVFEVVSRRVQYVAEGAWVTTYTCRIVG